MENLEDHEIEQSRMIDQRAGLDGRGIARDLRHITDDAKYDIRQGEEDHLATYADELVALGRVPYGKYDRQTIRPHPGGVPRSSQGAPPLRVLSRPGSPNSNAPRQGDSNRIAAHIAGYGWTGPFPGCV